MYCANAGDSRAIICSFDDGKWEAKALSRDHKPDDFSEAERVKKAGGRIEPSRLQPGMCPPSRIG